MPRRYPTEVRRQVIAGSIDAVAGSAGQVTPARP